MLFLFFSFLPLKPALSSSMSAFLQLPMGELQPGGLQCQPVPLPQHPVLVALFTVPDLSFDALHHHVRVLNVILHSITACYGYLCKTMVILYEGKQTKLTADISYPSC